METPRHELFTAEAQRRGDPRANAAPGRSLNGSFTTESTEDTENGFLVFFPGGRGFAVGPPAAEGARKKNKYNSFGRPRDLQVRRLGVLWDQGCPVRS